MARKAKESREYWRDREILHAQSMLKKEEEFARQLEMLYRNTSNEIEKNVGFMLERYASKNGLTMADVQKRLDATDIRDYEAKAAQYVREKNLSARANEEMAIYNLKMRTSRLELIDAHVNLDLIALTDQVDKRIGAQLITIGSAELARQSGLLGEALWLDRKGLEYIARRKFLGEDFSERLWKNKELLHGELQKRLSEAVITGQGSRDAARKLRQTVEQSVYNSERLMVTESARVQSEIQRESYRMAEITIYEYIATERSCPICIPLDGQRFNVRDGVPGTNMSPMHPHCKCSTAPYY